MGEERFKKLEDERQSIVERSDVERGIYIWKTEVERSRMVNRAKKERK